MYAPRSLAFPVALLRALACAVACAGLAAPAGRAEPAVTAPEVEGSFHGYPEMWTLDGTRLAEGDFTQWVEGGRIHIRNAYDFGQGHRIEERVVLQRQPLVQEAWSWRETVGTELQRAYRVDFKTGEARARKREGDTMKRWEGELTITPGRTFAGVGFTVALRRLRDRLVSGELVRLEAVAFTPTPRIITVTVTHAGIDGMEMGGRRVLGDRFVITPDVPGIVKLFIPAPATKIWLTHPYPATFLRWEGTLVEPTDPIVRVDQLPGLSSGPAQPAAQSATSAAAKR